MTTRDTGRILKAATLRDRGPQIAFDFEDVQAKCNEYLDEARARARTITEQATREAEAIRETARNEARTAGLTEGLERAEAEIERRADERARTRAAEEIATLGPALAAAAAQLVGERDRWIEQWETQAAEVAVAVAERILRTELDAKPERVRDIVGGILRLVSGVDRIAVRLHPDDVNVLGDNAERVVAQLASCGEAEIVADEALSRGGCIVDTRHGSIDARIETQLDRIAAELRGPSNHDNVGGAT